MNAPDSFPAPRFDQAHSPEVERAILAVLLDGRRKDCWSMFADRCPGPGVFFIRNHRLIALTMFRMAQAGIEIDAATVREAARTISYQEAVRALKAMDNEDQISVEPSGVLDYGDTLLAGLGATTLTEIAAEHAPPGGFEKNLSTLLGYAKKRQLINALANSLRQAQGIGDLATVPRISDDAINRISGVMGTGRGSQSIADCAEQALVEHDRAMTVGDTRCAQWGIESLDGKCRLGMGRLTILAARPSCGKTSLMLQACTATTKAMGAGSVAIVTLETLGIDLARTIIGREIGVGKQAIERGWMTDAQRAKYLDAMAAWRGHDIPIKDHGERCTVDDITAWIRTRYKRSGGQLALVGIDYLGLIQGTNPRHNTNERMGEITRKLKLLVLELQINVLLLCQMNRESEKERRAPRMMDIRDSGNIEQDADAIVFLWSDEEKTGVWPMNATIAKNKGADTSTVMLEFMRAHGQVFRELGDAGKHKPSGRMYSEPTDDEDYFASKPGVI